MQGGGLLSFGAVLSSVFLGGEGALIPVANWTADVPHGAVWSVEVLASFRGGIGSVRLSAGVGVLTDGLPSRGSGTFGGSSVGCPTPPVTLAGIGCWFTSCGGRIGSRLLRTPWPPSCGTGISRLGGITPWLPGVFWGMGAGCFPWVRFGFRFFLESLVVVYVEDESDSDLLSIFFSVAFRPKWRWGSLADFGRWELLRELSPRSR